ncbi:hypothetical protein DBB34_09125 [Sphaerisporangium cinnabarinum]|nr:hypothetical protein [Sphaerisporangium cinnabarinum]PTU56413.1 hypothetical protein DBB34_09125 [Sphaerisporangium cinnabarinum]
MALTDPYVPDVATRLLEPARHVHRVVAYRPAFGVELGRELALTTSTLTIDEDNAPRFVFEGGVELGDQELLDLLDPRAGTRLEVWAGYEYADRTQDVHRLADLGLRERIVRRPQNDVSLRAGSDELVVQDYVLTAPRTFAAGTTVGTVLASLLALGHEQPVTILAPSAGQSIGSDPLVVAPDAVWSTVQDLVDRIGAVAYHDGLTGFFVVRQPERAGAAALDLRTGPRGSLTATEVALDLEEFANHVVVEYTWRDAAGTEQVRRGWAEVQTGPFGTIAVGRRGRVVTYERAGTSATAQQTAAALVVRTLSRGRRIHVEGAVAAYWLRPEHTITAQLPLGGQERALVTRVVFDLPAGTMSVHTRQPETVTIHTGA